MLRLAETPPLDDALLRALLAAYPDRVARRREPRSPRGLMVGGRGVRLAEESAVLAAELFLCVDCVGVEGGAPGRREALVRKASEILPEWLPADRLRTAIDLEFDAARERVAAWKRTRYEDLVIAEAEVPPPDAARDGARLGGSRGGAPRPRAGARRSGGRRLPRPRPLAGGWMPGAGAPPLQGRRSWRELLPALAAGRKSFAELRRAPLLDVLAGSPLARAARGPAPPGTRAARRAERQPDRASPTRRASRRCSPPASRRCSASPRRRASPSGRVPVLLHLLAPNGRPQQVTHDLRSFWENTYPQVRKELAGRYPRHAWPQDPWNARPERRPQRR